MATKKFIDSFTFRMCNSSNSYELSMRSAALHKGLKTRDYLGFMLSYFPAAVGSAGLTFLMCREKLIMQYDGYLYTWHVDRYSNIIMRTYSFEK